MGFNGKSLILVGVILFIFQIANFISIETITPELERAQVLAAIASLIIILVGFLFKQFEPLAGEKAALKGENKFVFDKNMPNEVIDELAWGSEAILTASEPHASSSITSSGMFLSKRNLFSPFNAAFSPANGWNCLNKKPIKIKPVKIRESIYLLVFRFIFSCFG